MGRVGTKRSDRRWRAPDGSIWASEFEYRTYSAMAAVFGTDVVRRSSAGKDHTFSYSTQVAKGACLECGSGSVVQQRTYTPDVHVFQGPGTCRPGDYYIETKGYFSAERRNLFRSFLQANPDTNIMLVFQNNRKPKGMKRTIGEYVDSFYKIPWCVWDPKKNPELPIQIFDFLGVRR